MPSKKYDRKKQKPKRHNQTIFQYIVQEHSEYLLKDLFKGCFNYEESNWSHFYSKERHLHEYQVDYLSKCLKIPPEYFVEPNGNKVDSFDLKPFTLENELAVRKYFNQKQYIGVTDDDILFEFMEDLNEMDGGIDFELYLHEKNQVALKELFQQITKFLSTQERIILSNEIDDKNLNNLSKLISIFVDDKRYLNYVLEHYEDWAEYQNAQDEYLDYLNELGQQ